MSAKTLSRPSANRNGTCDLLRFIFSLLIMAHHIYQIGFANAPFHAALICVEFFFMISGFFMISHYEAKANSFNTEYSAKEALRYTFKKYTSLMYYILPCILLEYSLRVVSCIISEGGFSGAKTILLNLPLEASMFAQLTDTRYLPPIWYVSAMIAVMPLICFLYLRFRQAFKYIISWSIPVFIFIARGGVWPSTTGVDALMRSYCYISIGCFLYFVVMRIKRIDITSHLRLLFTCIELLCLITAIVLMAYNCETQYNLIVLLFVIEIIIMLSGCSYSTKLQGRFFSYLGKISLPIYTIHWSIGTFIWIAYSVCNSAGYHIPLSLRVVLYYSLSILSAMLFTLIVDKIKKAAKKKKA